MVPQALSVTTATTVPQASLANVGVMVLPALSANVGVMVLPALSANASMSMDVYAINATINDMMEAKEQAMAEIYS